MSVNPKVSTLREGDLIVLRWGRWGTQFAVVTHEPADGVFRARKWRERANQWTKKPARIPYIDFIRTAARTELPRVAHDALADELAAAAVGGAA